LVLSGAKQSKQSQLKALQICEYIWLQQETLDTDHGCSKSI